MIDSPIRTEWDAKPQFLKGRVAGYIFHPTEKLEKLGGLSKSHNVHEICPSPICPHTQNLADCKPSLIIFYQESLHGTY